MTASRSRSSWNGARIVSSDIAENAYETTSTTNGSTRAIVKRAPPSGEPASCTTAFRPVWAATRPAADRAGTTERTAPGYAAMKNAAPTPSTNAMTGIGQNASESSADRRDEHADRDDAHAVGSDHQPLPVPAVRRDARPAARRAPAAACARRATKPALAAEPVSASTSSGYAIDVSRVPMFESSCPVWSSMKSRLRRSGSVLIRPVKPPDVTVCQRPVANLPPNRSMPRGTFIPVLAYDDVAEAVAWLCETFGFRERWRAGSHRAQVAFGDGAVAITEGRSSSTGSLVMVRVDDVDGHYDRARTRGAVIVGPPTDYPYGERQYTAEDLGGHRWTFSQSIADVRPEDWGGTSGDLD